MWIYGAIICVYPGFLGRYKLPKEAQRGKPLLLPDSSGFSLLLSLCLPKCPPTQPKLIGGRGLAWIPHLPWQKITSREMYLTQLNVMARQWHFPSNNRLSRLKAIKTGCHSCWLSLSVNRCTILSADNWNWLLVRRKSKLAWLRLMLQSP